MASDAQRTLFCLKAAVPYHVVAFLLEVGSASWTPVSWWALNMPCPDKHLLCLFCLVRYIMWACAKTASNLPQRPVQMSQGTWRQVCGGKHSCDPIAGQGRHLPWQSTLSLCLQNYQPEPTNLQVSLWVLSRTFASQRFGLWYSCFVWEGIFSSRHQVCAGSLLPLCVHFCDILISCVK